VGSRFYFDARLGLTIPPETKIVRIDIDQEEIERGRRGAIEVRADAKAALGQLVVLVPPHNRRRPSRAAEVTALKERVWQNAARHEVFAGYAGVNRELLPDDGIFVSESTQLGYWASTNYPVYEPGTYITSGYQGTLGYGYATALGVQVGNPDRTVVSVNGDGGFMYNVQELSTQAQQRIPLVTLVFNDNAFGNIRRMQVLKYNGHLLASDLHNPDFVRLAESFGVAGYRAEGHEAFRAVLKQAIDAHEPALIEVPVPPAEESGVLAYQQAPPRPQLG
jgi:acetolactate synthase-1/2/3 large subunit